jgi:hypothetical protein
MLASKTFLSCDHIHTDWGLKRFRFPTICFFSASQCFFSSDKCFFSPDKCYFSPDKCCQAFIFPLCFQWFVGFRVPTPDKYQRFHPCRDWGGYTKSLFRPDPPRIRRRRPAAGRTSPRGSTGIGQERPIKMRFFGLRPIRRQHRRRREHDRARHVNRGS